MTKIIFLDIDGPMIPYKAMWLTGQTPIMTKFDPIAVGMLNNLCKAHGWKIAIHSSWIRVHRPEFVLSHCISQGIKAEHFHEDYTCDDSIHWRYTRVAKWLKDHPDVEDYVILDDEPYKWDDNKDNPHPQDMSLHIIDISYYEGFLLSDHDKIWNRSLPEENPIRREEW